MHLLLLTWFTAQGYDLANEVPGFGDNEWVVGD